jgi:hypothetical protein
MSRQVAAWPAPTAAEALAQKYRGVPGDFGQHATREHHGQLAHLRAPLPVFQLGQPHGEVCAGVAVKLVAILGMTPATARAVVLTVSPKTYDWVPVAGVPLAQLELRPVAYGPPRELPTRRR